MEPAGPHLPAQPPPVDPVARQPQPGVVVEPAGTHQLVHEGVDAGEARAGVGQIGGQGGGVGLGGPAGLEGFAALVHPFAPLAPEPLPVITPGELLDQLLAGMAGGAVPGASGGGCGRPIPAQRLRTEGVTSAPHLGGSPGGREDRQPRSRFRLGRPGRRLHPGQHRITNLREAQHAMADIGGQPRDGPGQMVATGAIGLGIDLPQEPLGLAATAPAGAGFPRQSSKPGREPLGHLPAVGELTGQIGGVSGPGRAQGGHRGTAATPRPAGSRYEGTPRHGRPPAGAFGALSP